MRCTGLSGLNQGYHWSGAEPPQSPRVVARVAIPSLNASGNELVVASGRPSAFRPAKVMPRLKQTAGGSSPQCAALVIAGASDLSDPAVAAIHERAARGSTTSITT